MAALTTAIVVVLLISLDHCSGRVLGPKELPHCEASQRLALDENREIVCRPYCGPGSDGTRMCLNLGESPFAASGGDDGGDEEKVNTLLGHRQNINDPDTYAVQDDRYVAEKPLERVTRKCNVTGGDVRACVAREIACHAKDTHNCIIWRRAAYIFCSKKFCGREYFKDCLLSHLLDDGSMVHTDESHVSTGGWESFREHIVHTSDTPEQLAANLGRLDKWNDTQCTETAPTIPNCEWTMMIKDCSNNEEDDDH